MAFPPDDDVVVDDDPEQPPGFRDAARDVDVGPARLRVAARVVVHQDQCARAYVERFLDHFARMDRRLVDRAVTHVMVEDQSVARVEIEHTHPLHRQVRHIDREIVEQRLPRPQHRFLRHCAARRAPHCERHRLEHRRARLAHAPDLAQRARIGVEHRGKRAESVQQRLGERLGVAARIAREQQVF